MTPSAISTSDPNSNSTISLDPTFLTTTSTDPLPKPSTSHPASPAPSEPTDLTSSTKASKTRKRKGEHILHQSTIRKPSWSYLHLELLTPSTLPSGPKLQPQPQHQPTPRTKANDASTNPKDETPDLDPLTARTLLHTPLSHFLGLAGTSIPLDILKIEGRELWVRVPRQDAGGVVAGIGGWVGYVEGGALGAGEEEERVQVGWRVRRKGECLGGLEDGGDLFGG